MLLVCSTWKEFVLYFLSCCKRVVACINSHNLTWPLVEEGIDEEVGVAVDFGEEEDEEEDEFEVKDEDEDEDEGEEAMAEAELHGDVCLTYIYIVLCFYLLRYDPGV